MAGAPFSLVLLLGIVMAQWCAACAEATNDAVGFWPDTDADADANGASDSDGDTDTELPSELDGDGWTLASIANPHGGAYVFGTSYSACSKSQRVDLVARGFSAAQLDAQPAVYVGEWFRTVQTAGDPYSVTVEPRNGSSAVLDSWTISSATTGTDWISQSHVFSGDGTGLRYIYFNDSGYDAEYWAGYHGAEMDDAYVSLGAAPAF